MSLLEVTQKWSYKSSHKKQQWKERPKKAIVRVSPTFNTIPDMHDKAYSTFCWTKLMLYCPFRNIEQDLGKSNEEIIHNWERFKTMYSPWHVYQKNVPITAEDDPKSPLIETNNIKEDMHDE